MVKRYFPLPLRAVQGFIDSVLRLVNVLSVCPLNMNNNKKRTVHTSEFKATKSLPVPNLYMVQEGQHDIRQ
ncbi:TPA: transposase [Vibrio parahaemolyticus]|nr:transposase [Vibrio parahaemolyticus]